MSDILICSVFCVWLLHRPHPSLEASIISFLWGRKPGIRSSDGQEKAVPFLSLFSVFGFDDHQAGRGCREKENALSLKDGVPDLPIPWYPLGGSEQPGSEHRVQDHKFSLLVSSAQPCWRRRAAWNALNHPMMLKG